MNKPLRILHLEDQPDFSFLVGAILEKESLPAEKTLVTDIPDYAAALEQGPYDLILADYILPSGNGLQALHLARQKCPEVPFVLLSGAIGEHAAIDILRSGATDYVLKSGLERLVPAIRRAVLEAAERTQRRHAENEARASERQYRIIFHGSPVPMWVSDLKTGQFLEVNEAVLRHYGYSRDEFLAMKTDAICSRDEAARLSQYVAGSQGQRPEAGLGRAGLFHHRRKDGTLIDVEVSWSIILFHDREVLLTMANDVTELRRAAEALKKSQARLAAALRIARLGSWELELTDLQNLDNNKLHWSDETYRIYGRMPDQPLTASEFLFNSVQPEDRPRVKQVLEKAFRSKEPYDIQHRILIPGGGERAIAGRAEFVLDESGKPVRLRGIVTDISDRQQPASRPPSPPPAEPPPPPTTTPPAAKPLAEKTPVAKPPAAKPAPPPPASKREKPVKVAKRPTSGRRGGAS